MANIRSKLIIAASLFWVATWGQPANAFFGNSIVFDPTHHGATLAQGAKRAAEAAAAIQVEINQYTQMIRDGLSLADPVFKPLGDAMRGLHSTYMTTQSLMYRAQNIDSMFGTTYPGYYSYLSTMGQGRSMSATMRERYSKWSDAGYENTRSAMRGVGMQVEGIKSEEALLKSLVLQANTSGGQKAALDAANQIAAFQARQAQDLNALIAQQNMLHANYMAQEIERRTFDNAVNDGFKRATHTNTKGREF